MTADVAPVAIPPRTALGVGLGCLAGLTAWGFAAPTTALRGWLIGFATVGSVPLGALAWLAIHGLTGGRWGAVARPRLVAAASALPLLLLAWLPLVLASRLVYPWAADPNAAGPDVAHLYLNTGLFALRGLIVLGLLSGLAMLARRGPLSPLAAGLCLVVYGVGMNLSAFDWLLSLDPQFNSSAFGAQIIVTQLVAALAVVILATAAAPDDPAWADFGALLLATVLGVLYLVYMTFLIDWYGDLPKQAAWYLRRSRHGWLALEAIGLAVGAVLPLLALLVSSVRRRPALLRIVAAAALAGVALEMIWLVAPESGGATMGAGLLATGAMTGLLLGVRGPTVARPQGRWSLADGR